MLSLSRRDFMRAGALATGGAWIGLPPSALAATKVLERDVGGFKLSVQSNSLRTISPELEPTIEHADQLGLDWIEIFWRHYEVTQDPARIAEVAAMLSRRNLGMESYFIGNMTDDTEAALRPLFEFARRAGVSVIVGQPAPTSFPVLDRLVREYDIKIGIHNYGPEGQYDRTEDTLIAAAPWDWRIGYCLDTGHCMRSGENPVEAVRRMGSRLFAMHLRDHESITRGQPRETIIGEGALDLGGLVQALRDVHFDGPLSLEMYYATSDPLPSIRASIANFSRAAGAAA